MNKLRDINYVAMVSIIIILAVLFFHYKDYQDEDITSELDQNKDGVVTKQELKRYIKLLENHDKKKRMELNEIKREFIGGFARGFIMGIILSDFEGGLALGVMLGAINPLMSGLERVV